MKKTDKYLNFFGDTQNYKMHNPLPNPYNLRGNPDLNANSADQGDGLNGTPDYSSFTGEVQDCALGEVTVTPGGASTASNTGGGGGFISAWFDGKRKYYKCENGFPISQQFERGQQPAGWETYSNPCLTAQQRQDKKNRFWGGFGDALTGLTQGYESGLKAYQPGGTTAPQFDPNATNTTTTTTAGAGGNIGKTVGWVMLGLVGVGLLYMVVKTAGKGGGGSTDDYISKV